jgi:hypothetical protein
VYAALLLLFCRRWLASEGGLPADLTFLDVPNLLWERACSRMRPYSRPTSGRCTHPLWELACQRRRPPSRPVSCRCTQTHCRSEPARDGDLTADLFPADVHGPTVGASLLANAVRHSTAILTDTLRHREQARAHNDPCCPVAARPLAKTARTFNFFLLRNGTIQLNSGDQLPWLSVRPPLSFRRSPASCLIPTCPTRLSRRS